MPAPKATSHGFGGAGGAAGAVTFISAARTGVANATAATADKMILLICCPSITLTPPRRLCCPSETQLYVVPKSRPQQAGFSKSTHETHSKAKTPAIA